MSKNTMTKPKKVYTYPVSAAWVENGQKYHYITQLYQIGIYIILNDDPALQACTDPKRMVGFANKLKLLEKKNKISDLAFGTSISVSDQTGFWEETEQTVKD